MRPQKVLLCIYKRKNMIFLVNSNINFFYSNHQIYKIMLVREFDHVLKRYVKS